MMNDEQRIRDTLTGRAAGLDVGRHADSMPDDAGELDSDDENDTDQEEAESKGRGSFLREMVVLFVVALTIALVIKSFVVQPFYIPSGSMENTLMPRDKVLVNKLVYHLRPIQRGDIVVFNGTGSWDAPARQVPQSSDPVVRLYDASLGRLLHAIRGLFGTNSTQIDYIKRVIGLPGDHVVCCNAQGLITVNGVPLHEKSFLIHGARPSQGTFNVVVPRGRLWVMGDNRPLSADSRLHDCAYTYLQPKCVPYDRDGTIPENMVIGRAFMIVWPPSRFRILPIPSTFLRPALDRQAAGRSAAAARSAGAAQSAGAVRSAGVAAGRAAGSAARPGSLPAGVIALRPSASYLPLAAGFAIAAPLTLFERRIRLRRRGRRRRRRG